jgi:hypothetical protein
MSACLHTNVKVSGSNTLSRPPASDYSPFPPGIEENAATSVCEHQQMLMFVIFLCSSQYSQPDFQALTFQAKSIR